jgi:hypothetical protein
VAGGGLVAPGAAEYFAGHRAGFGRAVGAVVMRARVSPFNGCRKTSRRRRPRSQ